MKLVRFVKLQSKKINSVLDNLSRFQWNGTRWLHFRLSVHFSLRTSPSLPFPISPPDVFKSFPLFSSHLILLHPAHLSLIDPRVPLLSLAYKKTATFSVVNLFVTAALLPLFTSPLCHAYHHHHNNNIYKYKSWCVCADNITWIKQWSCAEVHLIRWSPDSP